MPGLFAFPPSVFELGFRKRFLVGGSGAGREGGGVSPSVPLGSLGNCPLSFSLWPPSLDSPSLSEPPRPLTHIGMSSSFSLSKREFIGIFLRPSKTQAAPMPSNCLTAPHAPLGPTWSFCLTGTLEPAELSPSSTSCGIFHLECALAVSCLFCLPPLRSC